MLPSPTKRRKISPTIALPIPSDVTNESSAPHDAQTQASLTNETEQKDAASTKGRTQRRASFQSPTKASLARFNPALIPAPSPKKIPSSPSRATLSRPSPSGRTIRSAGRSGAKSRPSLVQQVLGRRTTSDLPPSTLDENDTRTKSATTQEGGDENQQGEFPKVRKDSFSNAIAKAFDATPATQPTVREPLRPRQPSGSILTPGNTQDARTKTGNARNRSLRPSQGEATHQRLPPQTSRVSGHDEEQLFSLVTSGSRGHTPEDEPELPPTPTQLGISAPPDQPRGLDSLSSSGRRRRFRDEPSKKTSPLKQQTEDGEATVSSPLKQKSKAALQKSADSSRSHKKRTEDVPTSTSHPQQAHDKSDQRQRAVSPIDDPASGLLRDGHELSSENEETENDPNKNPEPTEQRKVLAALKSQLGQLQSDLSQLEALSKAPDEIEETLETMTEPFDSHLYSILIMENECNNLQTNESSTAVQEGLEQEIRESFQLSIHTGSDPLPFLALFKPGNLRLKTRTKCVVKSSSTPIQPLHESDVVITGAHDRVQLAHNIELNAPGPFPAHMFSCSLEVLVDPADRAVVSIKVLQLGHSASRKHQGRKRKRDRDEISNNSLLKSSLGEWITRRLKPGSLHERDVGGLIWGIGQWWKGTVERARCFASLERHFINDNLTRVVSGRSKGPDLQWEDLLPFLYRDAFMFHLDVPNSIFSSKRKQLGLHISYILSLDWTSEIEPQIRISASGLDLKSESRMQDVFTMLMQRKKIASDGLVKANQETWEMAVDAVLGVAALLKGR